MPKNLGAASKIVDPILMGALGLLFFAVLIGFRTVNLTSSKMPGMMTKGLESFYDSYLPFE